MLVRVRFWLIVFMAGLVISGITAFPLQTEVGWLSTLFHGRFPWIERVNEGICATNAHYPFLAYGTDWLAFAHLVLAIAFIGPYADPVRNKWVVDFGLIACAAVIPLALIAGHFRGIPFGWRLIDCSFGVFGCIPLLLCRRLIAKLEATILYNSAASFPEEPASHS